MKSPVFCMTDNQYFVYSKGRRLDPCPDCDPAWKSEQAKAGLCRKATRKISRPPKRFMYRVTVEVNGIEYPSIAKAAETIGVSTKTIWRRCRSEEFPTYRRLEEGVTLG